MSDHIRGIVKSINQDRGYAFLGGFSNRGKSNVFAHASAFNQSEWQSLAIGVPVEFELSTDRDGRPCATRVSVIGATVPAIEPAPRGYISNQ